MKYFLKCTLALSSILLAACFLQSCQIGKANQQAVAEKDAFLTVKASNLLNVSRAEEVITIPIKSERINVSEELVVLTDQLIPSQKIDKDNDGVIDEIKCILDFQGLEEKILQVVTNDSLASVPFKKRTQAELSHKVNGHWEEREYIGGEFQHVQGLRVPDAHTDHSYFIRYEGPGWESDKVAYRFYLDWRNGMDVFGKTTNDMVLQNIGLDGFDSYHELSDWGMDVLKVGKSLGLGAIAKFEDGSIRKFENTDSVTCDIMENGILESKILTNYYGWKTKYDTTDLASTISIQAGSRMTLHTLGTASTFPDMCTGLVKNTDCSLISGGQRDSQWAYIASYGKQSLNEDKLGMAVFYQPEEVAQLTEDEYSHIILFKPIEKGAPKSYYFLAAWELETEGITHEEAFVNYLNHQLQLLNNPIVLSNTAKETMN